MAKEQWNLASEHDLDTSFLPQPIPHRILQLQVYDVTDGPFGVIIRLDDVVGQHLKQVQKSSILEIKMDVRFG